MRIEQIRHRLQGLGAGPGHQAHVLHRRAQARPQDSGRRRIDQYLPQALRATLPALVDELADLARLLVEGADGQTVESMLLPRGGLCVSTQGGCAVGCVFGMTGQGGLLRRLGSTEIVAQLPLARTLRPVNKVVFMGVGEPGRNLDNAMEAIELLGNEGAIDHKNIVFSTVGDERVFKRLASLGQGRVKPVLALSLQTTKPALRTELLPRAPRITPAELVQQGERYARATGYPIQYQWIRLACINDGDDEVDGIVESFARKYAIMNMILYNSVEGLGFSRLPAERAATMARALNRRGVLTKLLRSAGQYVEAGCGQLRARTLASGARGIPIVAAAAQETSR
jgi:23S rRNA (adenine2503-C2)-methyltransferase